MGNASLFEAVYLAFRLLESPPTFWNGFLAVVFGSRPVWRRAQRLRITYTQKENDNLLITPFRSHKLYSRHVSEPMKINCSKFDIVRGARDSSLALKGALAQMTWRSDEGKSQAKFEKKNIGHAL